MLYWAHSENSSGRRQHLADHLNCVASLAKNFGDRFGWGEVAYWAGLWHDLGKVDPRFQQRLVQGTSERVDHKGAGVALAAQVGSRIIQFATGGHHGGLVDAAELESWFQSLDQSVLRKSLRKVQEHIESLVPEELEIFSDPKDPAPELDFLIRIIFSSLVDADFLDTQKHFQPEVSRARKVHEISGRLLENFDSYHKGLTRGKTGQLNELRRSVYIACVEKAANPLGFFRLTVPTGGGKTLSSLAFALRHALAHDERRVIYAIPYTSIIEQTAGEFKKIFPARTVLEHHTGIHAKDPEDYPDDKGLWARLSSENWDAPLIVTTTVQLFESLFGRTPSVCRKLHNIANSVIILDEAQTLPLPLFPTIIDALKNLVQYFGVTVVFCTATQPSLDRFLQEAEIEPTEIAPDPKILFRKLERVRYHNYVGESWEWRKVAETMREVKRAMVVVNTKKDARELWETCEDNSVYHLSAAMCPAHRTDVLSEIRDKLRNNDTCHLVATQVVEAGVDIDFDRVLRAIGPLDRIVQAAGRCNREGKMDKGDVIIFNPEDGSVPRGVYGVGKHRAEQLLSDPRLDLNDPDTFPAYFESVQRDITERHDIEEDRRRLRFRTVAEKFRMIDDDTFNVVVEYEAKTKMITKLVHHLKSRRDRALHILRELQPFMVSLRAYEIGKCDHLLEEIHPSLYYWYGRYHPRLGLLKEIDLSRSVM